MKFHFRSSTPHRVCNISARTKCKNFEGINIHTSNEKTEEKEYAVPKNVTYYLKKEDQTQFNKIIIFGTRCKRFVEMKYLRQNRRK